MTGWEAFLGYSAVAAKFFAFFVACILVWAAIEWIRGR